MPPERRICGSCLKPLSKKRLRNKYCYTCEKSVVKARRETTHRLRVAETYGMDVGDYDLIYAKQGGKCAICWRATGKTRRLSVDHDHKSGKVRGLLCSTCNRMLGHARDDTDFFARAINYLTDPPAENIVYNNAA
jgi:hypothetical protein